MRRTVWPLLMILLASCQGLSEDHELYGWLNDSANRMGNIVRAPQNEFDDSMRRLNSLPGNVSRYSNNELVRGSRLPKGAKRLIDNELSLTGALPRSLVQKTQNGFDQASHRVSTLANPDKLLLTPNGWRANLSKRKHSLTHPIQAIDLDRPILPDPADEAQITTIESPLRKPSLLERILKRLRL